MIWKVSLTLLLLSFSADAAVLIGTVVDSKTNQPVAARIYVNNSNGEWMFVDSANRTGSAIAYREEWVPMEASVERHTTVSAHPFKIELKPGTYTVTVERGKEYVPQSIQLEVGKDQDSIRKTFALQRWVNMSARGWYSGETHVHRRIRELPNVMLAEDLNVAFPVTFWTTSANSAPHLRPSTLRSQGPSPFGNRIDRGAKPIVVDEAHVIYPRNTEYEVFDIDGRRHVLGAMFILNHQSVFQAGAPPVKQIAEQAHQEGAIIDLDKHSWPWSMMLVPIAKVDLYELSNNSVWRTNFGFRSSSVAPAAYMNVEMENGQMSELGWLTFGFENYYTLLNCGFRLKPTAGTASGVHPVPLGFSRVYVHTGTGFDGQSWLAGLKAGRSFVTTGPMLFIKVNQKHPGHVFDASEPIMAHITGELQNSEPLNRIELVMNGRKSEIPLGSHTISPSGSFCYRIDKTVELSKSSWIAVRCFQFNGNRVRFAHSAPWHFQVAAEPVRPRREETDYLIQRIKNEIARNRGMLADSALAEYHEALQIYTEIAKRAHE